MAHEEVFARLREILIAYEGWLPVLADRPGTRRERRESGIRMPPTPMGKPGTFVAAARDGKAYASFHLMPVYAFPDLVDAASPQLRKRMQGKSCFNFSRVDEPLFTELEGLTARGIERFRELDVSRMSAARPGRSQRRPRRPTRLPRPLPDSRSARARR